MNDVLLGKKVSIERCVEQIRKYDALPSDKALSEDYLRQDAIILNIQRGCELAIDMANYIIRARKLGVPNSARESFETLSSEGVIPSEVATKMSKMVGFRNVLVHRYQNLDQAVLISVINHGLPDLLEFAQLALAALA